MARERKRKDNFKAKKAEERERVEKGESKQYRGREVNSNVEGDENERNDRI